MQKGKPGLDAELMSRNQDKCLNNLHLIYPKKSNVGILCTLWGTVGKASTALWLRWMTAAPGQSFSLRTPTGCKAQCLKQRLHNQALIVQSSLPTCLIWHFEVWFAEVKSTCRYICNKWEFIKLLNKLGALPFSIFWQNQAMSISNWLSKIKRYFLLFCLYA